LTPKSWLKKNFSPFLGSSYFPFASGLPDPPTVLLIYYFGYTLFRWRLVALGVAEFPARLEPDIFPTPFCGVFDGNDRSPPIVLSLNTWFFFSLGIMTLEGVQRVGVEEFPSPH